MNIGLLGGIVYLQTTSNAVRLRLLTAVVKSFPLPVFTVGNFYCCNYVEINIFVVFFHPGVGVISWSGFINLTYPPLFVHKTPFQVFPSKLSRKHYRREDITDNFTTVLRQISSLSPCSLRLLLSSIPSGTYVTILQLVAVPNIVPMSIKFSEFRKRY